MRRPMTLPVGRLVRSGSPVADLTPDQENRLLLQLQAARLGATEPLDQQG